MPLRFAKLFALLIAAFVFSAGCLEKRSISEVELFPRGKNKKWISRVNKTVKNINERNQTVEDSAEWLMKAYSGIGLRNLRDIPREEYEKYAKAARLKEAYIIVFPAYYVFFENSMRLTTKKDAETYSPKNLVERFYEKFYAYDYGMTLMQEQTRLLKNFLEFASTDKRLVILILPQDYINRFRYGYIEGQDEYARYINEATNMSDSVIYAYSAQFGNPTLDTETFNSLVGFLSSLDVKDILIGGAYVGRQLDTFHDELLKNTSFSLFVVPEIAAISPRDLDNNWGRRLMTGEGRVDFDIAAQNLMEFGAYGFKRGSIPEAKRLNRLYFYPPRTADDKKPEAKEAKRDSQKKDEPKDDKDEKDDE